MKQTTGGPTLPLHCGGVPREKLASQLGVQPHALHLREDSLQIAFAAVNSVLRARFMRKFKRRSVRRQCKAKHDAVVALEIAKVDSVKCGGKLLGDCKDTGRGFIDPVPRTRSKCSAVPAAPELQQPAERRANMLACRSVTAMVVGVPCVMANEGVGA